MLLGTDDNLFRVDWVSDARIVLMKLMRRGQLLESSKVTMPSIGKNDPSSSATRLIHRPLS